MNNINFILKCKYIHTVHIQYTAYQCNRPKRLKPVFTGMFLFNLSRFIFKYMYMNLKLVNAFVLVNRLIKETIINKLACFIYL